MQDAADVATFQVLRRVGVSDGRETLPRTAPLVQPEIVLCGWCGHFGRPHVHARSMRSRRWRALSHAEALERARNGRASHGLCPACLPLAVSEWDAEAQTESVTGNEWPRRQTVEALP